MIIAVNGLKTSHIVSVDYRHIMWDAEATVGVYRVDYKNLLDVSKGIQGNYHFDEYSGLFTGDDCLVKLTDQERETFNNLMQSIQDRLVEEYGASQDMS